MIMKIRSSKLLMLGLVVAIGLLVIPATALATHTNEATPLLTVQSFQVTEFAVFANTDSEKDPYGITVDPAGFIYTVRLGNGVVTKISPDGLTKVVLVDLPDGTWSAIYFDSFSGDLFAGNWPAGQIFRIDANTP
ncbi:MAG: hypothetical protein IH865_13610, partial [Chloroflexi bacterium]|nr:hypothetical protein [Chloroflexota bacterium]